MRIWRLPSLATFPLVMNVPPSGAPVTNTEINPSLPLMTATGLGHGWYYGKKSDKNPVAALMLHRGEGTRNTMWYDPSRE